MQMSVLDQIKDLFEKHNLKETLLKEHFFENENTSDITDVKMYLENEDLSHKDNLSFTKLFNFAFLFDH